MKIIHHIHRNSIAVLMLASLAALATASCKKLITIPPNPPSAIVASEQFEDSLSTLSAAVNVYSYAASSGGFEFNNGYLAVSTGLTSDELLTTTTYTDDLQFYGNSISPVNNSTNATLWQAPYLGIYPVNAVIEGVAASTGLSASFKVQITAEMKVVRALYYFQLVNLFGEVPLVTSTDYQSNALLPRSPIDSVYALILADLLSARQDLPTTYPSSGHLRPNQYTASALLAKTYLYLGQWQNAFDAADAVISSNTYSLTSNLNNVFLDGSPEAIWQLPANHSSYGVTAEAYNFVPYPGSVPNFPLTSILFNAFETGDQRLQDWVGVSAVDTGTGAINLYYPYKYKNTNPYASVTTEDYMIFRLGELYLIHAEAAAQLGNTATALTDLNLVRARAGLGASTATTQPQVLAAIAHERQVELFTEWGNRWEDLKRTGVINTVLGAEKPDWTANAALYPVPQAEITLNDNLSQNQGY